MKIEIILQTTILFGVLFLVIHIIRGSKKPKDFHRDEVLVDTCALIDGRILQIAKSGFIPGILLVPKFVIAELQMLADGKDPIKRERARTGLDMIAELQNSKRVQVEIIDNPVNSQSEVDDKLVALAKSRNTALYTTDYNLNKVAVIEGVNVLNVNELSQLLRPTMLPGEVARVQLIQKGNDKGQAVGYLDDGTMVVVNNAAKLIGKEAKVEVDRYLQTAAGKMMFAKLV